LDLATADILGHIGYAILTVGMILIAHKKLSGWAFRAAGETLWIFVGFAIGISSMWTWGIFFLGLEFYGYRTWKKKLLSKECIECGRPNAEV
jgi:hypothetical protein